MSSYSLTNFLVSRQYQSATARSMVTGEVIRARGNNLYAVKYGKTVQNCKSNIGAVKIGATVLLTTMSDGQRYITSDIGMTDTSDRKEVIIDG
jgi:hypothetical protein